MNELDIEEQAMETTKALKSLRNMKENHFKSYMRKEIWTVHMQGEKRKGKRKKNNKKK